MSATPLTSVIGQLSVNGDVVETIIPAQANDETHVQTNPDAGRIVLRNPYTGYEHTSVAQSSTTVGTQNIVLIHEAQ